MINSNISSGGIKFHLGSLTLTSVIHEKYDEDTFSTAKSVEMSLPVKSVSPIFEETDQPVTQARQSPAKVWSQYDVTRSSTLPNLMFEARESLPALDAVKQILPMYYQLVKSPPDRCESVKPYLQIDEPVEELVDGISGANPEKRSRGLNDGKSSFHLNAEKMNADNEAKSVLDKHVITVLDYQTKELDRYRQAIRQMGELIVDLRSKISTLEMKNSQLRANVYYTGRSSSASVDAHDENSYTGSIKRDFMATVEEVEEQKIAILKLQNELIKKNEYEKKYLKLLKAHQSQQAMLHDYQGKMSKYSLLEKTCKQQEKIIRELESNGTRSKSKKISLSDNTAERSKTVSFQEDPSFSKKSTQLVPLQNQVIQPASLQLVPNPLPSKKFYHDQFYDVEERMTLLQKLEKAEGRIMALESQIMDNTRLWAREKSQNKFRIGNGIPDFSGFERRFPAPLTYPNDQIVFEDGFYGKPNQQLRGQDAFTRFHHL
ncbi:coiled-coil domain-containing protein 33-like isoform X3 [Rhopilema esculentum]